jgi:hypothetical protein
MGQALRAHMSLFRDKKEALLKCLSTKISPLTVIVTGNVTVTGLHMTAYSKLVR